ncbi:hypothetical protein ACW5R3_04670 [Bizionia sp. KMM 8389]
MNFKVLAVLVSLVFSINVVSQVVPMRSESTFTMGQSAELLPNQILPPQDYFGSLGYIEDTLNPINPNPNSIEYVSGSPFGFEGDANILIIHTSDDKYYKFNKGNYNASTDKLVVELENNMFYEFDDKNIKFALLNKIKTIKLTAENSESYYFFVIDESNDYSILKRIRCKITPGTVNKMTKEKESQDRYYVYDEFYIYQDGDLQEIKLNNKTFKLLFSENEKAVKKYMKDQDLSIKNEADFLKMLRYNKTL